MTETEQFKSWQEIKEFLEADENNFVYYSVWSFNEKYMNCYDGCCYNEFVDIEECMEYVQDFSKDYKELTKN